MIIGKDVTLIGGFAALGKAGKELAGFFVGIRHFNAQMAPGRQAADMVNVIDGAKATAMHGLKMIIFDIIFDDKFPVDGLVVVPAVHFT